MDELTFEIALVYFRLTAAARELLGQGKHSPGRRSVLRTLARDGPRSLSEMARDRSVSRQHVHTLVRALRSEGLVRLTPDPRDRRARLVELTPAGGAFTRAMIEREAALLEFLAEGIPSDDLVRSLEVLRALRSRLDSEGAREALG